jgi:GxxExxY protein
MDFNFLEVFNTVGDTLGKGYSECVYHEAICVMLRDRGVSYSKEVPLQITFLNTVVGNVRADILVPAFNLVIECKATEGNLKGSFISQTVNYMEITGYTNGFLVNFNQHPGKDNVEIIIVQKTPDGYVATTSDGASTLFNNVGKQIQ